MASTLTPTLMEDDDVTAVWRSSTRCDSNQCVEVLFFRSSRSGENGCCVEAGVCDCGETVYVRDSKDPNGPRLKFTPAEWDAFTVGVKTGEFDMNTD